MTSSFLSADLGRAVLLIYVGVMPVIDLAAPTPWTPLPMIASITLLVIEIGRIRFRSDRTDMALCLLLVLCLVPWLWSNSYLRLKALSHLFALVSVMLLYYWLVRESLSTYISDEQKVARVLSVLSWSLIATSVFVVGEFLMRNFLAVDLDAILPYATRPEYAATIYGGLSRSRGFAAESGHMGLFFDLAVFLCVPRLRTRVFGWLGMLLVGIAVILLFSVGTFFALAAGAITYMTLRFSLIRFASATLVIGIVVAGLALTGPRFIGDYIEASVLPKLAILWSVDEPGSAGDRLAAYREAANLLARYPFGIGIGIAPAAAEIGEYGGASVTAGHISLPAVFGVAGGVLAIATILTLQAYFIYRGATLAKYGPSLASSGLALTVHYLIIGNYWYPFLWFFWALVIALERLEQRRGRDERTTHH